MVWATWHTMDLIPEYSTRMVNWKMNQSEFVRHQPCENCGSSDAKSLYSDGHTYCFVCHHRVSGDGQTNHTHQMSKDVHLKGAAERLKTRNISEKTCQFYWIYRDEDTLRFPYFRSTMRLYSSSTATLLGVKRRRRRQASFHLARSRLLAYRATKTLQTLSKMRMLKRYEKRFGTLSRSDLMESLMQKMLGIW